MYCLDTNIIIDFLRDDQKISEKIRQLHGHTFYVTAISLCELYKGAHLSHNQHDVVVIDNFMSSCEFVDFNAISCKLFGYEHAQLKKKGRLVGDADIMIASIVKANDLILVTRNKKDFENISGLKIEVW